MANVVLIRANPNDNSGFFPRVECQKTESYQDLAPWMQNHIHNLYIDYFYRRQEVLWRSQGMERLPLMKTAANMLVCAEDLGMVPKCVPDVLSELCLLGLRIQRMPHDVNIEFAHPNTYSYLNVCSPSTHDMSTLRGWWEEDRGKTQKYYNHLLTCHGEAPKCLTPELARKIFEQHVYSDSVWAVFSLQDLFAINEKLHIDAPFEERINEPSNPEHYWRYRLPITIEQLMEMNEFNQTLRDIITKSGRLAAYL